MDGYFIAEVKAFAGNFAPRQWSECAGQLLAISANSALFSLLGTMYGGDGRTTFGLPDLRGRVPIGSGTMGTGPGLTSVTQGGSGGGEDVLLNAVQIPSHTHESNAHIAFSSTPPTSTDAAGNQWSLDGLHLYSTATVTNTPMAENSVEVDSVSNTGGSQGHENMNPYIVMKYIICLVGIYPSRN